jgi:hypothetical protein
MIVSLGVAAVVATTQSCSGGKKTEENRTASGELLQEDSVDTNIRRMQLTSREYTANLGGKEYSIHITCAPDDNLPTVTSETDVRFADNRISLSISQADRKVLTREFTKQDFAQLLDEPFLRKAVLNGMVYSKTEGGKMVLAASCCYPQTDMCVPVIITVTPDGQLSMAKSDLLEDDYTSGE